MVVVTALKVDVDSERGDRNFRRHKEEERHGRRRGTKSSSYGKKKQTKDRRPKESAFKPYFKG